MHVRCPLIPPPFRKVEKHILTITCKVTMILAAFRNGERHILSLVREVKIVLAVGASRLEVRVPTGGPEKRKNTFCPKPQRAVLQRPLSRLVIHVYLALNHPVIQLAAAVGFAAIAVLKGFIRADDRIAPLLLRRKDGSHRAVDVFRFF